MRELISGDLEVIVSGNQPVTHAANAVTRTVPFVMTADGTPVALGFVQSLARPGSNVTGLTYQSAGTSTRSDYNYLESVRTFMMGL